LARLSQRDDPHSWDRLVALYTPLLHSWLARHAVQPADRDDLVQDVLLVVLRELPQFKHNRRPGAFRTWLRTILANRLRMFWRERPRRLTISGTEFVRRVDDLTDPDSDLSRTWDQEHDRSIIGRILQLLRPEFAAGTWQAFRRVVLEGADPAAVAAELGVTVSTVYSAKSRIMKRFRQEADGLC
jgi:RNA polymerase sigma-70 factor (ECF subfamily)